MLGEATATFNPADRWWCSTCARWIYRQSPEYHGEGVCETSAMWGTWRDENSEPFAIIAQLIKQVYETELRRDDFREQHPGAPVSDAVVAENQQRADLANHPSVAEIDA